MIETALTREIHSIDELAKFEIVSPNVSEKYVPIFTSDIIEILAPEFEFDYGLRFVTGSTKHFVDLVSDEGILRIYNSYDRTLAFRMSYIADGMSVDLGVDRVIHMGQNAKELVEKIRDHKDDILTAFATAKLIVSKLSDTPITKELAEKISDEIFYWDTKKKGFQGYDNFIDMFLAEDSKVELSVFTYIQRSIKEYLDGNYTYVINGTKKNGRKTKAILTKVYMEKRILNVLEEEFLEYFI